MKISNRILFLKKIAFESTEESPPSQPPQTRDGIEVRDPAIAHESWLVDSLRAAFGQEDSSIEEFINKNRTAISDLRRSFQKIPRLLGAGKDGVAFDIGGEKVLKIFSNEFSYQKAVQAISTLHSEKPIARTEAMVHDAGSLGDLPNGRKVFFSIIEKMQPISENPMAALFLKKLLKLVKRVILNDHIKAEINYLRASKTKSHRRVRSVVNMIKSAIVEDVGVGQLNNIEASIREEMGLELGWLEKYLEEIVVKAITHRFDLHLKNVGATSTGWMRYFDSSYLSGSSDDKKELPITDKELSVTVPLEQISLEEESS